MIKMGVARFDIEKFTGKSNFGLWMIKMKALWVQQGLADALKEEIEVASGSKTEEKEKISDMLEKAHSTVILCLCDKTLREVSKETSVRGVWMKLESLYMAKTLAIGCT